MERLRVFLAEDHAPMLNRIQHLLSEFYEIVGTAGDGPTLIAEARRLRPDLILLDVSLPLLNGLQAARQIARTVPESKLVFLTQHAAPQYVQAAFRTGARGYVLKETLQSELLLALSQIISGFYYVTPKLFAPEIKSRFDPATNPSELFGAGINSLLQDVLKALQKGRTEEEIARELHVSVTAVESAIEDLSAAWNAQTKDELIRYGMSTGLLRT